MVKKGRPRDRVLQGEVKQAFATQYGRLLARAKVDELVSLLRSSEIISQGLSPALLRARSRDGRFPTRWASGFVLSLRNYFYGDQACEHGRWVHRADLKPMIEALIDLADRTGDFFSNEILPAQIENGGDWSRVSPTAESAIPGAQSVVGSRPTAVDTRLASLSGGFPKQNNPPGGRILLIRLNSSVRTFEDGQGREYNCQLKGAGLRLHSKAAMWRPLGWSLSDGDTVAVSATCSVQFNGTPPLDIMWTVSRVGDQDRMQFEDREFGVLVGDLGPEDALRLLVEPRDLDIKGPEELEAKAARSTHHKQKAWRHLMQLAGLKEAEGEPMTGNLILCEQKLP